LPGLRKNVLDYVTRRFNTSSAGLKKPVGLDLRWNRRFTRSPDPTELQINNPPSTKEKQK
jgi:hypothetical protein